MTATGISRIEGIDPFVAFKAPCKVATVSNITLSGAQTIDGVSVVEDDRVLVRSQTDATGNGIYVAKDATWVRADDFNGARDIVKGTIIPVNSGSTTYGSRTTFWEITTANPITVGTSSISFTATNALFTNYTSNYETIADALADSAVANFIGTDNTVRVKYYSGTNLINADYDVVAAGTGTHDGFEYHSDDGSPGGSVFQLKLRIPEVKVNAKLAGIVGGGVTDNATVTNTALGVSSNLYYPPGTYAYDSSINVVDNMVLEGAGYQKTTLLITTASINLIYAATAKSKITLKNLTLKGSGSQAAVERLVYLISCTDITIENCRFENSSHQIHLETCTRASIKHNRFENALRLTSFDNGYGVIATLDSDDIQVNENHFKSIQRHCIYFTSGTSNSEMIGNVANDVTGAPWDVFSTTSQNTCRNITIDSNIVDGITAAAGGSDDRYGILATGNIQNLTITNNKIYNNNQSGGILLQHGSTDANTLKTVKVLNNIIDTCTGEAGINVLNGEDLDIRGNTIKDTGTTYSGINIAVSGSGVGSFVTGALIEENNIDNANYGLNIAGVDGTHKATGIVVGDNQIKNTNSANYNMGDIAYIEYKTKWETATYDFFVDNAAASQTDTVMTAGNGSGFNCFIAPFTGRLYSIFGKSNAAISGSSITFELRQNGANRTNAVTIAAGDLYEKAIFALNTRTINEGDEIQMIYTTDGSYAPTTNEFVCGMEIVRDINA